MTIAETRAKIKAGIWQAVARSEVDVSALPHEDVDKLVGAITDPYNSLSSDRLHHQR